MSDDDLIRRGDALAAIQLGDTVTKMQARIRAITPAVTQPAPDAAFASGFKAGLKAAAEHWFRGVSGVRQLLPETKAQILAIPCPQPAPTAQLDAGDVREAALRQLASLIAGMDAEAFLDFARDIDAALQTHKATQAADRILALTEKPHDR